jgi:hypothetical protein
MMEGGDHAMEWQTDLLTNINCPYSVQAVRLQRVLFHIWCFLASEGISDEALEYLREHSKDPAPFEQRI